MKRPFLIAGILSLVLSFAALYLGKIGVIVFSGFTFALYLTLFILKRKLFLRLLVPLFFVILAIFNSFATLNHIKSAENLPLEEKTLKGVVTESPKIYPSGQAIILESKEINGKAWIFSNTIYDIKAGDKVSLVVDLQKMDDTQRENNYSKGIYLNGFLSSLNQIKRPDFSMLRLMADFREGIENTIFKRTNQRNAPLLIALTTGNKSYISGSDQRAINNAGVSHIMAVSGLHLGIICLNLNKLLKRFKVNDKIIGVCGMFAVFLVLLACGFQISAIRASVVYIILLLGKIIHRKGDGLNSLFVAITLIVTASPLIIGNVSFLLSVSSTFGIIVLYPMLSKLLGGVKRGGKIGKVLNEVLDIALVSFAAVICAMPILVYYFESISTVQILVNVLVLYVANNILMLTALGLIISIIPIINIISVVVFFVAQIGMEYFMAVVRFFGSNDSVLLYMKKEMFIFWIIFDIVLFIFSYLGVKRSEKSGSE